VFGVVLMLVLVVLVVVAVVVFVVGSICSICDSICVVLVVVLVVVCVVVCVVVVILFHLPPYNKMQLLQNQMAVCHCGYAQMQTEFYFYNTLETCCREVVVVSR